MNLRIQNPAQPPAVAGLNEKLAFFYRSQIQEVRSQKHSDVAPANEFILIEPEANPTFWILYSGSWILFHVAFGRGNFL